MKSFLRICVMISIGFSNVHGMYENYEPLQTACLALKPVKWLELFTLPMQMHNLTPMLWKVTRMDYYNQFFGANLNVCTVFHYGPDCGAIHFSAIKDNRGKISAFQIAYNAKTENIFRLYKYNNTIDQNYVIMQGQVLRAEYINANEEVVPLSEIPEQVKKDYESMYAAIALAPHYHWMIFRTCDLRITWVKIMIPTNQSEIEMLNLLEVFEVEINAKLEELGVDKTSMTDVRTSLPFMPAPPTL